jgi:hypothetical protein
MLSKLPLPEGLIGRAKNHQSLADMDELLECFVHFFSKGSAAERHLANQSDFRRLLAAADSLKKEVDTHLIYDLLLLFCTNCLGPD